VDCPRADSGPGQTEHKPKVVEVLRAGLDVWRTRHRPSPEQARYLGDLDRCRTAALGGHLYVCDQCHAELPVYNGCRNRHCPNCQALAQNEWIEQRRQVLLPVGHHHVVFTFPAQLRPLALRHAELLYRLLFDAAAETLSRLAEEALGIRLGITAVLHTWKRDLGFHPHLHCIVTGGGLSLDGARWLPRPRFLFPAKRMKAVFRVAVLAHLHRLQAASQLGLSHDQWVALLRSLPQKRKWVIFAERPFGRSTHVLEYLGRYTHRVAISNSRIVSAAQGMVSFTTRDGKVATLPAPVFLDRFLIHILPFRFRKIRHYGLYAPGAARLLREKARRLLGPGDLVAEIPDATRTVEPEPVEPDPADETVEDLLARLNRHAPRRCAHCGVEGTLRYALTLDRVSARRCRPPPS